MTIYLIRHGQTDLNKEHRMQGRQGLPLNETGINQAKKVKEKLKNVKFDAVYSSPQERAITTATIVSGKNPIIDKRLDVYDLGSADTLKQEDVKMIGLIPDPNIYSGVEKPEHYIKRINNFIDHLIKKYGNTDKTILVAGHKCTVGCISAYFVGMPDDGNFLKLSATNAEYKIFTINKNTNLKGFKI